MVQFEKDGCANCLPWTSMDPFKKDGYANRLRWTSDRDIQRSQSRIYLMKNIGSDSFSPSNMPASFLVHTLTISLVLGVFDF